MHLPFFSTLLSSLKLKVQLFLQFPRLAPSHPLQHHNPCDAADIREPIAALGGISRTSTPHFVSFQRRAPAFPPAISAEIVQFLQ